LLVCFFDAGRHASLFACLLVVLFVFVCVFVFGVGGGGWVGVRKSTSTALQPVWQTHFTEILASVD
jgi:hypothetical protein